MYTGKRFSLSDYDVIRTSVKIEMVDLYVCLFFSPQVVFLVSYSGS